VPSFLLCYPHFRNRYLTKICDQVIALLSSKHSASIVWDDEGNDSSDTGSVEMGDPDRLVTFVVEETADQENGARLRPGFQVCLGFI
jgi:hypothetical protein